MEITKNTESYFLCLLLKKELESHRNRYKRKFYSTYDFYIWIKQSFITLKNFKDFIQKSSKLLAEYNDLLELRKQLTPGLEFVEYVRNKICGHIDDNFIKYAIMWNPHVVEKSKSNENNKSTDILLRVELFAKSLVESAVNSFIVDVPKQSIFKSEIDFFYTPSYIKLRIIIVEIINTAIEFIDNFSSKLEKDIVYYDDNELINAYEIAKIMDFGTKRGY